MLRHYTNWMENNNWRDQIENENLKRSYSQSVLLRRCGWRRRVSLRCHILGCEIVIWIAVNGSVWFQRSEKRRHIKEVLDEIGNGICKYCSQFRIFFGKYLQFGILWQVINLTLIKCLGKITWKEYKKENENFTTRSYYYGNGDSNFVIFLGEICDFKKNENLVRKMKIAFNIKLIRYIL